MSDLPELGEWEFTLGDDAVSIDLDKIVPINAEMLDEEFTRQPSLYAYIAVMAARAEAQWYTDKRAVERARAQADQRIRSKLKSYGDKVVEASMPLAIDRDDLYDAATEHELDSRFQHLVLKALTSAMDQRAQMLISLGAHQRAEAAQTQMSVNDLKATLSKLRAQHTNR